MLYNMQGVLYNIKCYMTPCYITGGGVIQHDPTFQMATRQLSELKMLH
jgi:hypothetical protein